MFIIKIIIAVLSVLFFLIQLYCLFDIAKSKFQPFHKIIWILLVLSFSIIGSALYLNIGVHKKIEN